MGVERDEVYVECPCCHGEGDVDNSYNLCGLCFDMYWEDCLRRLSEEECVGDFYYDD